MLTAVILTAMNMIKFFWTQAPASLYGRLGGGSLAGKGVPQAIAGTPPAARPAAVGACRQGCEVPLG